jgi:hypothetical protein
MQRTENRSLPAQAGGQKTEACSVSRLVVVKGSRALQLLSSAEPSDGQKTD